MTWQRMYGGREWMTDGAEMVSRYEDGTRTPHRTYGEPVSVRGYWRAWEGFIRQASDETGVPIPLILATICTENGGYREVAGMPTVRPIRKEPGYESDETTPHRISVGPCHLLISTARSAMGDPSIDRAWLESVPNNLRACAAYIAQGKGRTEWDPILVAARYNSGGLYDASNPTSRFYNRWHLRSYGAHLDRFADWYGDALAVMAEQEPDTRPSVPPPVLVVPSLPPRRLQPMQVQGVEVLNRAAREQGVSRAELRAAGLVIAEWLDEILRSVPWYARAITVVRAIRDLLRSLT